MVPPGAPVANRGDTIENPGTGPLNAQEAFIQGRILITGDQQKLMDSQAVVGAMSAVFDSVRANTSYE